VSDFALTNQVTRWSPDTCGCVLEYEWDDTVPQDSRVHSFQNLVKKCSDHGSIPVAKDVYDAVLGENRMKNLIFAELQKEKPDINAGEDFDWVFDKSRKLTVFCKGVTAVGMSNVRNKFPGVTLSTKR